VEAPRKGNSAERRPRLRVVISELRSRESGLGRERRGRLPYPLERVVGGRLEYAGPGVRGVIQTFRDTDAGAADELSCQAQLKVDETLTPALTIAPCCTGPDEDPAEHRALRSASGLVSDGVRFQGFLDQQRIFDPGYGVDRDYGKSHFLRQLPDELISELLARMAALGRPPGAILLESLRRFG
jgi:hypothetical protein